MIENVKLSAIHFWNSKPETRALIHDDDWISNGYWMIQRSNVVNQSFVNHENWEESFSLAKFYTQPADESSKLPDFWTFIAFEPDEKFTVTNWVYKTIDPNEDESTGKHIYPAIDLCLLIGVDGSYTFVNALYLSAIGIGVGDILEGKSNRVRGTDKIIWSLRSEDLTRCVASYDLSNDSLSSANVPALMSIDKQIISKREIFLSKEEGVARSGKRGRRPTYRPSVEALLEMVGEE